MNIPRLIFKEYFTKERQMQINNATIRAFLSRDLMDLLIRAGLIAFVTILCVRIFAPFAGLLLWALILAVALYPLHRSLASRLGGRQGWAASLLVIAGLLLIGVPTAMLGSSFAGHIHDAYTAFENDEITITPPSAGVADWPLVGKKVYSAWSAAAEDLPGYLSKNKEQLTNLSKKGLAAAASTTGGVLMLLGAMIIAGIMMAYGESGSQAMRRIFCRLSSPEKGPRLHSLSTATVRSVATGVIGVAFIQALLLGVGFIAAGIPAAGVLALIVIVLGILQLPALLVSLPVIIYLWAAGDASTTVNIAFTIYLLLASMADNVLKPMLLGRGVDAPMPVVLLGALGGMISGGIIGLFLGAVLLALGYQIFMEWVAEGDADKTEVTEGPGPAADLPAGE
jgi:predicted PurR-regulated permease PerM